MPTKNAIKVYAGESYYHIYSRGVNKEPVFRDEQDFGMFISLFKRYLSTTIQLNDHRMPYPNYHVNLQLIAYALMRNHFHLFVYQHDERSIEKFMRSLVTSYSMYFNKRHKRVGPVFQSRYLALRMTNDAQFYHITRYIHLNPKDWRTSYHTSLDFYLQKRHADWIHPELILDKSPEQYMAFLEDYTDRKTELEEIKWTLANQDH